MILHVITLLSVDDKFLNRKLKERRKKQQEENVKKKEIQKQKNKYVVYFKYVYRFIIAIIAKAISIV